MCRSIKFRRRLSFSLLLLCAAPLLVGQESDGGFGASLAPAVHIPVESYLGMGYSVRASAMYRFSGLPVYAEIAAGMSQTDSTGIPTEATVRVMNVSAGTGAYLSRLPFLDVFIGGRIGWGFGSMVIDGVTERAGAFNWGAVGGVSFPVLPRFALSVQGGVVAQMNTHLAYEAGLGVVWSPGPTARSDRGTRTERVTPQPEPLVAEAASDEAQTAEELVQEPAPDAAEDLIVTATVEHTRTDLHLVQAGFGTVFPVFYRFYDENPVGFAILKNAGERTLENIDVMVNIPAFMDLPQRQEAPENLEPGEEVTLDLQVLFNNSLLSVTEGTRVAAQIAVSFRDGDESSSYSANTTLSVTNRNAMTWDDDRKAASFVTAKDPAILEFAKNVAGIVRAGGRSAVSTNLRTAMAMLEAFNLYGLDYVIDPTTPHVELSENPHAIDFLQFPVQTFAFGAGDCDDLSICYTSCLEAVGVSTAFITVPGHIYAAFNTSVPEQEIGRTFPRADDVIICEGEAWVPVEVTMLDRGFAEAWTAGAQQWRQHNPRGQAELIPMQTAWQAFEPVGFDLGERQGIGALPEEDLLQAYLAELEAFVQDAIQPQASRIQRSIDSQGPSPRLCNNMGILYAKFEQLDEARRWFEDAAGRGDYAPAYVNLGHLDYLDDNYIDALRYYEQAEEIDPDDATVILAISRAHHELENYGFATAYYERLQIGNPELAGQFAYLQFRDSDTGRASDAATAKEVIIWGEAVE